MDIQEKINSQRNGVEGDFFNFLPVAAAGVAVLAVVSKKKNKKYAEKQLQDLQASYPFAETSSQQDLVITKLKAVKAQKQNDLKVAKSSATKKSIEAYIGAINQYLMDANDYRKELAAAEKADAAGADAGSQVVSEQMSIEQQKVLAELQPAGSGSISETTDGKKKNIFIYAGIGVAVLVILVALITKKKQN